MLNFDEARFLRIQSGAVGAAPRPIDETIGRLLAAGAENIFFLGTGGAAILMQPAAQLLQRQLDLPGLRRDLGRAGPRRLAPSGAAPSSSSRRCSGTTKESVEALGYCKAQGARSSS